MSKKNIKNKTEIEKDKKPYKLSIWLYILFFLIPFVYIAFFLEKLDNDLWYLLAEGRYIVENGIYHIDPLSMHQGFEITVQNWLSASIMWLIYKWFGKMGIFSLILICNFGVCFFLYKISDLISENKVLSLVCMLASDLVLTLFYMVSRPQIFSFVLLLAVIYVLELYAKTENKKYLRWLPILSIIEANMHGSLWFMIFLFALPYIIDGIKCEWLHTQGYKLKPLLIYLGIALVCGLINPYGYKMITFIFTSFTDKYMHIYINELLPFNFNSRVCKAAFIVMLLVGLCYAYFRKGNIRVRYICLFAGTLILGFISIKGFSHFFLVSIFPLSYFFKDMFPKDFHEVGDTFLKGLRSFYGIFSILFLGLFVFSMYTQTKTLQFSSPILKSIKYVKESHGQDKMVLYTSFNNGGTAEYFHLKPYIDPRAEAFLKINNKKADIFEEYYRLQHGEITVGVFLDKYKFTHLILASNDAITKVIRDNGDYFLAYQDLQNSYNVYILRDLYTDEQIKEIQDNL